MADTDRATKRHTYHFTSWHMGLSLLPLLALDIDINPGAIRFPCGKAVRRNDCGIACDTFEVWFHTRCIVMCDSVYFNQSASISWNCFACVLPNVSASTHFVKPLQTPSSMSLLQDCLYLQETVPPLQA